MLFCLTMFSVKINACILILKCLIAFVHNDRMLNETLSAETLAKRSSWERTSVLQELTVACDSSELYDYGLF